MNHWLIKSEPFKYSWQKLVEDKHTFWDGVRNYQARNYLRTMEIDDLVFFYHSNEGKCVVGVAKVIKTAYQDPTTDDDRWSVVEVEALKPLSRPVTLAEIKKDALLQNIALVRQERLSVMPLKREEFDRILELSEC